MLRSEWRMENRELWVALQVLAAINERKAANDADLEELRSYAPSLARLPSDELACEVIREALKVRAQAREIPPLTACATCEKLMTAVNVATERHRGGMGELEAALIRSDDRQTAELHQKVVALGKERDATIMALREHQQPHAKGASAT